MQCSMISFKDGICAFVILTGLLTRCLNVAECNKLTIQVDDYFLNGTINQIPMTPTFGWPSVRSFPLPDTPEILIFIQTQNYINRCGILASSDDGMVRTDGLHWKCSDVEHPGWMDVDHDDSLWNDAKVYGLNDGTWRPLAASISPLASWIWGSNIADGAKTFCRGKFVLRNKYTSRNGIYIRTPNSAMTIPSDLCSKSLDERQCAMLCSANLWSCDMFEYNDGAGRCCLVAPLHDHSVRAHYGTHVWTRS